MIRERETEISDDQRVSQMRKREIEIEESQETCYLVVSNAYLAKKIMCMLSLDECSPLFEGVKYDSTKQKLV